MPNRCNGLPLQRLMGSVDDWLLAIIFSSNRGSLPTKRRRMADVGEVGPLQRRLNNTLVVFMSSNVFIDSVVDYLDEESGYHSIGPL